LAFAAAMESGLLSIADVVAWADGRILQLDRPPAWLLDLCLARTQDAALGVLSLESNRRVEAGCGPWLDLETRDDLVMGFLYLRFERGDLTMGEMLGFAGAYSDAHSYRIDCGTFYYMLNEIDGGGPIIASDRPLGERIVDLFTPMAELARRWLKGWPTSPPEPGSNAGTRPNIY